MSDNIEYTTTGKPHPFHLVQPSIWPITGAFAAGLLAIGAILFMHPTKIGNVSVGGLYGVFLGLIAVASVMFVWWKDIIKEAVIEKAHSPVTKVGLRYGMALFIASEVMFFVAFFWAFFSSALFPAEAIGFTWPPQGLHVVDPFDLPLLMTLILLLSGCTVTWAHHAILHNHNFDVIKGLGVSVMLGMSFLVFQIYEYGHTHFAFKDTVYAGAFFMATGFHGFHVFVGTVFLAVCYFRAQKGHFKPNDHFGFEAAAWYWHFVDVVWLFLFLAVYFWGNVIGVDHTALHPAAAAAVAP